MVLMDWLDLRNMLLVARTVVLAALARTESRGAHQREDFPEPLAQWELNQVFSFKERKLALRQRRAAAPVGGVAA